jgi:hypothetical protein
MTDQPILIAGEPVDLLLEEIPSLEIEPLGGAKWRVAWRTDTEAGAAWARAMERYAADLLTVDQPVSREERLSAALFRIGREIEAVRGGGV